MTTFCRGVSPATKWIGSPYPSPIRCLTLFGEKGAECQDIGEGQELVMLTATRNLNPGDVLVREARLRAQETVCFLYYTLDMHPLGIDPI